MAESRRRAFATKSTIRMQQAWSREMAVEASQSEAHTDLVNRYNTLTAKFKKAQEEAASAKAKAEMARKWQEQISTLLAEKEDWRMKEKRLTMELEGRIKEVNEVERSKKEVVRELEEKSEMCRKVESEKEDLRAELATAVEAIRGLKSELAAQAKMCEQQKQLQGRRINAHIGCSKGRIVEKVVKVEDLDTTEVCFADPERGIACHHITVVQEPNGAIKVHARNTKRRGKLYN